MADNNSRSYRSRDPYPRDPRDQDYGGPNPRGYGNDPTAAHGQIADPLAELARLIGQGNPADGFDPNAAPRHGTDSYDPAQSAGQAWNTASWAADERYAQPGDFAEQQHDPRYQESYDERGTQQYDERYEGDHHQAYVPERRGDARYADGGSDAGSYGGGVPAADRGYDEHQASFAPPRAALNDRDAGRGLAAAASPYRDEPDRGYAPQADDRYDYEDEEAADDQYYADPSYAAESADEETPRSRGRRGLVVVASILGLVVLGTAGAFAYRTMFGGSVMMSLPPIIKADTSPTKIVPNAGNSQKNKTDQASADAAGAAEKLVSREENPVDVPVSAPASTAPRVVNTIPIFPAPDSSADGALMPAVPGTTLAAPAASSPPMPATPMLPPAPTAVQSFPTAAAPAPSAVPAGSSTPRKIHTVIIRSDQTGGGDAAPPAPAASAPVARPVATPAAPVARPLRPQSSNGPMSILPSQSGEAPPRARTAMTQPTSIAPATETTPVAGGGYAVQVTSQRSEAEAQSAFRALRARFPAQLGNREPIVRRADLGSKGVYYRALVGPFASMEQAADLCSSLKAAGGSCLVQRN